MINLNKDFYSLAKQGLAIFSMALCFSNTGNACSRVLYNTDDHAVMVARNMDWSTDLIALMQTNLLVLPKGMARSGKATENPIRWTSRYGSVVATALMDSVATDGMNEKGLAVHTLWLDGSDYGVRDKSIPGLSINMWVQFFLDNFQSVDEAVNYLQNTPLQIVPFIIPGVNQSAPQHLGIEDSTGDSAIIEYLNGKLQIHHSSAYTVMTNEPAYDLQIANLKQYEGFGGSQPIPGTISPKDRFVRLAYYVKRLPKPRSVHHEVAELLSVLETSVEPFEVKDSLNLNPIPTLWQAVADLTHKTYYFRPTTGIGLMWLSLSDFNLDAGAPVMRLEVANHDDLHGDVSKLFKVYQMQEG